MRFVIAALLVVLYAIVMMVTTKGIEGVGTLISFMIGTLLAPAFIAGILCIPKTKRNNKRFFRIFNVVLFLALLGQSGNFLKFIEKSTLPPRELVGANSKVKITIPGSWVVKDIQNENVILNMSNGSGYLNIMVGYEYAGTDRLDLEHYAQYFGVNYKENIPDFESITEIKNCVSAKMECVYQVVNTTTGKKGTTSFLVSLSGIHGFYNFLAITNPGLVDTYRDDIFTALSNFEEIEK